MAPWMGWPEWPATDSGDSRAAAAPLFGFEDDATTMI